ncbi:S-layer homology domain-containing protein [Paenibacillus maysiensis]|nr:S-layer homology domain-containing protein [Paenibacillus maysiensis]
MKISAWAQAAVRIVTSAGLMKGYTDGTFVPEYNATRAEVAQTIAQLIK